MEYRGIVRLQALGRHDNACAGCGVEDASKSVDQSGHVGKERFVVVVAADIFESRRIKCDGKFGVGDALEADAADLMMEAGRIAHQYDVGTEEESLIKFGREEAIDEMNTGGNVILGEPRRTVAENNMDVVRGEILVESLVGNGLADKVFVALARRVKHNLHLGSKSKRQLSEDAVGSRFERRYAAMGNDVDVREARIAERTGHVVVVDNEVGLRGETLHGVELCR